MYVLARERETHTQRGKGTPIFRPDKEAAAYCVGSKSRNLWWPPTRKLVIRQATVKQNILPHTHDGGQATDRGQGGRRGADGEDGILLHFRHPGFRVKMSAVAAR